MSRKIFSVSSLTVGWFATKQQETAVRVHIHVVGLSSPHQVLNMVFYIELASTEAFEPGKGGASSIASKKLQPLVLLAGAGDGQKECWMGFGGMHKT